MADAWRWRYIGDCIHDGDTEEIGIWHGGETEKERQAEQKQEYSYRHCVQYYCSYRWQIKDKNSFTEKVLPKQ